jgi:hypothetical protein
MDNLTFQQSLLFFVLGAFGQKDGSAACFPRILLRPATSQTHSILRFVIHFQITVDAALWDHFEPDNPIDPN